MASKKWTDIQKASGEATANPTGTDMWGSPWNNHLLFGYMSDHDSGYFPSRQAIYLISRLDSAHIKARNLWIYSLNTIIFVYWKLFEALAWHSSHQIWWIFAWYSVCYSKLLNGGETFAVLQEFIIQRVLCWASQCHGLMKALEWNLMVRNRHSKKIYNI